MVITKGLYYLIKIQVSIKIVFVLARESMVFFRTPPGVYPRRWLRSNERIRILRIGKNINIMLRRSRMIQWKTKYKTDVYKRQR